MNRVEYGVPTNFQEFRNRRRQEVLSRVRRTNTNHGGILTPVVRRAIILACLVTAGALVKSAVDTARYDQDHLNNDQNLQVGKPDLYGGLSDYLYSVFNGQDVGIEGKNIRPLLEKYSFEWRVLGELDVPGKAESDENKLGNVARWAPVMNTPLTLLPRGYWKNRGDEVSGLYKLWVAQVDKLNGSTSSGEFIVEKNPKLYEFYAIEEPGDVYSRRMQLITFPKFN